VVDVENLRLHYARTPTLSTGSDNLEGTAGGGERQVSDKAARVSGEIYLAGCAYGPFARTG